MKTNEGLAWAQLERDAYVGYLPFAALGSPAEPTHRVAALAHPRLSGAERQAAAADGAVARRAGDDCPDARAISRSARTGCGCGARHLAEVGSHEPDFVAVAERFLETPYLWGGRTSEGIDCSGLVQTALTAAGIAAPRDSDMLEAALGEPCRRRRRTPLSRGDLVFWKGHVGIMRDARTLLHANGWHMKVVSEPLAEARARIAASGGGEVTSVRRMTCRRGR